MSQPFSDKSCHIVFVDPSGPVRQSMAEVLKNMGYKNAQGVSSIQDAYAQMETEEIHWLIVPLGADQPVNAMHLLGLCVEVPHLRHIRVSLLLDQAELNVRNRAFELGALSWHPRTSSKIDFQKEMEKLVSRLEGMENNLTLVAASYIRDLLQEANDPKARLAFEQSINSQFPGNPRLLLSLAKAQNAAGQQRAACSTLGQAKILGPELAVEADNVLASFGAPAATPGATGENIFGIDRCIVIDSDDSVRTSLVETFKELGIPNVKDFADGESAWKEISSGTEPGLIVMEWKIPQLSGPQLIQRIRHHGFHTVPIVIHSSLVKQTDLQLLKEISVAGLAEKPYEKTALMRAIVATVQQERTPTEHQAIERKFRTLLSAGKTRDAQDIIGRFITDPAVPDAKKRLVEAELAFAAANYSLARNLAVESLKGTGDSILSLNILAKSLLRLGDYGNAMKCFEKGQKLSPANIERLCLMAEAQAELGNDADAAQKLTQAATIDSGATQVQEAVVRVTVISGPAETAQKLMATLESAANVVSYLNNKAVASTRIGKFDEGFELYDKTLKSLPADHELRSIVHYNLGLAKVRAGDYVGAAKIMEQALSGKNARIGQKAKSIQVRLKSAIEKGTQIRLNEDEKTTQALHSAIAADGKDGAKSMAPMVDSETATLENLHASIMEGLMPARGEVCCYKLFQSKIPVDPKVTALFNNPPKFQRRATIEKADSGGLEKAMKATGS